MFRKPTVFILGAGASWHYGYPTGEELAKQVIAKADALEQFFAAGAQGSFHTPPVFAIQKSPTAPWHTAAAEAAVLSKRLRAVNPTLIDYFLAQNQDLHDIGRLAIALVIFECEFWYHEHRGNPNHQRLLDRLASQGKISHRSTNFDATSFDDDWLRFALYKATRDCTESNHILQNEVHFVTFNYDTSLERRLFDGLYNISLFQAPDITEFLWNARIFHVYGAIREKIDSSSSPINPVLPNHASDKHNFGLGIQMLNTVYPASLGIRTIDGEDKTKNTATIEAAKNLIDHASRVYILGFGFDSSNVTRLGLNNLRPTKNPERTVFFTNYGGHNRVSIAAGKTLFGNGDIFIPPTGHPIQTRSRLIGHAYSNFRYEMSVKNVYDALAQDFESLETG